MNAQEFIDKRKESLINELIRLFLEGNLTAEKANGIAGALSELRYFVKEKEIRSQEETKNRVLKKMALHSDA